MNGNQQTNSDCLALFEALARRDSLTNGIVNSAAGQDAASLQQAANLFGAANMALGNNFSTQQLAACLPSIAAGNQESNNGGMNFHQNFFPSMDASQGASNNASNASQGLDKDVLDDLYKILNKADPTRDFNDNQQGLAGIQGYQLDQFANQGGFGQQNNTNDPFALLQQAQQSQQAFQLAEQLQQRRNSTGLGSLQQQFSNNASNNFLQQATTGQLDASSFFNLPSTTQAAPNAMPQQQQQQLNLNDSLKKPAAPAASNKLPLRALSAYNFFFRDERDRIVHGGEYELTADKKKQMLAAHWFRDRTKKRRHRKTHGKIAFTELSRVISQRWKELDETTKAFYQQVAAEDLERYHRELDQYKMAEAQAAVASAGPLTATFQANKDDSQTDGARAA